MEKRKEIIKLKAEFSIYEFGYCLEDSSGVLSEGSFREWEEVVIDVANMYLKFCNRRNLDISNIRIEVKR